MGLTYFKRFRMEYDLNEGVPESKSVPFGYELVPFSTDLIRDHATAKFHSFRCELDANVFPCLGRRDGCLRLMREITHGLRSFPKRRGYVDIAIPIQVRCSQSGRFRACK